MDKVGTNGFDSSQFDLTTEADEGHEIEVIDPRSGRTFDARITIVGEYSPRIEAWQRQLFERRAREERLAKKSGRSVEMGFDELQEQLVQKASAHTIGWTGIYENGQPVPFSDAAAQAIYRKQRWLRDLVLEEARVLSNFSSR